VGSFYNWNKPKPSDRSIFRKIFGRALLNQDNNPYLNVWENDYIKKINREESGYLRDIDLEKDIEGKIARIIRESFTFKFLIIQEEAKRIGEGGLEKRLIGTIGSCNLCNPSVQWYGRNSPVNKIQESGLWQVQHLNYQEIDYKDMKDIEIFIQDTLTWLGS
jgi:hypothetical protein